MKTTISILTTLAAGSLPSYSAVVLFAGGTVTYTLDPDISSAGSEITQTRNPMPLYNGGGGFNETATVGSSSATGTGTAQHFESPSVFGITLSSADGVSQNNAGSDFTGAASFTIAFTATWDITVSSFGPTAFGYANFPTIAWNVAASPGAYVSFELFAEWNGGATRSDVNFSTGNISAAGSGSTNFFDSEILNPTAIPAGTQETISGFLRFTAYGGASGSSDISLGAAAGTVPDPDNLPEPGTSLLVCLSSLGLLRRRR